jgi:hypothetical protein
MIEDTNPDVANASGRLTLVPVEGLEGLHTMLKDAQEDIERLATDNRYLMQRDIERQQALDRLTRTVRCCRQELKASAPEYGDERTWRNYVPREPFYQLIMVVCALANETWKSPQDGPPELDEMLAIRDGFEKHGASYV